MDWMQKLQALQNLRRRCSRAAKQSADTVVHLSAIEAWWTHWNLQLMRLQRMLQVLPHARLADAQM
jgi:hypothetical protein